MDSLKSPIPTIDLRPYLCGPSPNEKGFPSLEQQHVSSEIDAAFQGLGFLFLEGLDFARDSLDAMYRHAQSMFSLPADVKEKALLPITRPAHVGYFSYGSERLNSTRTGDMKEAYNFKFNNVYKQDFRGCPRGFADDGQTFWNEMCLSAQALAVAMAVAFDLPYDHFLNMLGVHSETAFRLIHYPPCNDAKTTRASRSIRCGEHTDYCLFTLLFTDGPGLQAKAVAGGEFDDDGGHSGWVDIPVPDNARGSPHSTKAIVNLGGLMARCTNDVWRATAHRVIVPDDQSAQMDRYTVACFFAPDSDVISYVHPKIASGSTVKYNPITTEQYFEKRLAATK